MPTPLRGALRMNWTMGQNSPPARKSSRAPDFAGGLNLVIFNDHNTPQNYPSPPRILGALSSKFRNSHQRPTLRPIRSRAGRGLRLLAICGLGWAAGTEAQTTGHSTDLLYDRNLLQGPSRFEGLELSFPVSCVALREYSFARSGFIVKQVFVETDLAPPIGRTRASPDRARV